MVIGGVLILVTVGLLAATLELMYPPGSGVSLHFLDWLAPGGGGVGVVLIAVGAVIARVRRP